MSRLGACSARIPVAGVTYAMALLALPGAGQGMPASVRELSTTVTHFTVSAPRWTLPGQSLGLTVRAEDMADRQVPGYTGTVRFSSSDPTAILPSDCTFTRTDAGEYYFRVTLTSLGPQTITVTEIPTQPPATSPAAGTAATDVITPDRAFVQMLFNDALGRTGDPGGVAHWTGLLEASSQTRAQVTTAIISGTEYQAGLVFAAYLRYLRRQPDPGGLEAWTGFLAAGGTVEQMAAAMASSPEYRHGAGGSDRSLVARLYLDILERPPDFAGQNFWESLLAGGILTPAGVATAFLSSEEYHSALTGTVFSRYLDRRPTGDELGTWVVALNAGLGDAGLIVAIAASSEYARLAECSNCSS